MQSENTSDLSAALAKAQSVMEAATFNRTNPHFKNKYADLAAVLEAIRKPLADNGLAITQTTEIREGGFVLVTTLRHATGQWISSEYPLPIAAKPQELGSALTYARRYSLSAIACIAADEDDDAEAARQNGQAASTPKPKSPVVPQAIAAPVDPETGEIGPHRIKANGDAVQWGGMLIAAVNTARNGAEIDQWMTDNDATMAKLATANPKTHKLVLESVTAKREALRAG
jgi:hypothetical protein